MLVALGIFLILFLVAKVLIPVLAVILKFFLLLTAIAPYILFIGVGVIIGTAVSDFKNNSRSNNKEGKDRRNFNSILRR